MFKSQLRNTDKPTRLSLKLILVWVAISDDFLDDNEIKHITTIFGDYSRKDIKSLINTIQAEGADCILPACQYLASSNSADKMRFIEIITSIAVADGKLSISENHILCFMADLLAISPKQYQDVYMNLTGQIFPDAGDPSVPLWWESKLNQKNKSRNNEDKKQNQQRFSSKDELSISKSEAYVILGLHNNATHADIKQAYRRMSKLHHPDKFHSIDEEAFNAASAMFLRIKKACEVLSK